MYIRHVYLGETQGKNEQFPQGGRETNFHIFLKWKGKEHIGNLGESKWLEREEGSVG